MQTAKDRWRSARSKLRVVSMISGSVGQQSRGNLLHLREVLTAARKEYVFSTAQIVTIVDRLGGAAGPRVMVLKELFSAVVNKDDLRNYAEDVLSAACF